MAARTHTTAEEDLVRRFQGGDEGAFESVVLRYHPRLQALAYRITGDLEEARDIGQVALVRAHDALSRLGGGSRFRGEARLATWLYRVVLNLCRDRYRKATASDDHVALLDPPAEEAPPDTRPDGRTAVRETAEAVARAVRALPDREREVVLLRHYHDLAFTEIAEILGEPATTVKSRMTKGLRLLRGRLEDHQP